MANGFRSPTGAALIGLGDALGNVVRQRTMRDADEEQKQLLMLSMMREDERNAILDQREEDRIANVLARQKLVDERYDAEQGEERALRWLREKDPGALTQSREQLGKSFGGRGLAVLEPFLREGAGFGGVPGPWAHEEFSRLIKDPTRSQRLQTDQIAREEAATATAQANQRAQLALQQASSALQQSAAATATAEQNRQHWLQINPKPNPTGAGGGKIYGTTAKVKSFVGGDEVTTDQFTFGDNLREQYVNDTNAWNQRYAAFLESQPGFNTSAIQLLGQAITSPAGSAAAAEAPILAQRNPISQTGLPTIGKDKSADFVDRANALFSPQGINIPPAQEDKEDEIGQFLDDKSGGLNPYQTGTEAYKDWQRIYDEGKDPWRASFELLPDIIGSRIGEVADLPRVIRNIGMREEFQEEAPETERYAGAPQRAFSRGVWPQLPGLPPTEHITRTGEREGQATLPPTAPATPIDRVSAEVRDPRERPSSAWRLNAAAAQQEEDNQFTTNQLLSTINKLNQEEGMTPGFTPFGVASEGPTRFPRSWGDTDSFARRGRIPGTTAAQVEQFLRREQQGVDPETGRWVNPLSLVKPSSDPSFMGPPDPVGPRIGPWNRERQVRDLNLPPSEQELLLRNVRQQSPLDLEAGVGVAYDPTTGRPTRAMGRADEPRSEARMEQVPLAATSSEYNRRFREGPDAADLYPSLRMPPSAVEDTASSDPMADAIPLSRPVDLLETKGPFVIDTPEGRALTGDRRLEQPPAFDPRFFLSGQDVPSLPAGPVFSPGGRAPLSQPPPAPAALPLPDVSQRQLEQSALQLSAILGIPPDLLIAAKVDPSARAILEVYEETFPPDKRMLLAQFLDLDKGMVGRQLMPPLLGERPDEMGVLPLGETREDILRKLR